MSEALSEVGKLSFRRRSVCGGTSEEDDEKAREEAGDTAAVGTIV